MQTDIEEKLYYKIPEFDWQPMRQQMYEAMGKGKDWRTFRPENDWMKQNWPIFWEWFHDNFKVDLWYGFVNNVPANNEEPPHIDNTPLMHTINLNIPISNWENSKIIWFKTDPKNVPLKFRETGGGFVPPEYWDKLEKVDETRITGPSLVKSHLVHRVLNPNPTVRRMFIGRMKPPHKLKKFADVFKI